MDICEVIATISTLDDDGSYINEVADEYREGADMRTLIPLLTHDDSYFVEVGSVDRFGGC